MADSRKWDVLGFVSGPHFQRLFRDAIALRTEQRGDWQISETRPYDTLGERDFSTGRALPSIGNPSEVLKAGN